MNDSTNVCVCSVARLCPTLCDPLDCSPPGFSSMGFLRQEYWSGCHFLLQGIVPTQNRTCISCVSCIADGFFTQDSLSGKPDSVNRHIYWVRSQPLYLSMTMPLIWASLVAQLVKNLPAIQETWVQSLGWEDPLEKEMATHSSTLD